MEELLLLIKKTTELLPWVQRWELEVVTEWATFSGLRWYLCFIVSDLFYLLNFDPQFTWVFCSSHIPMARWTIACRQVVISSLSVVLCIVFFLFWNTNVTVICLKFLYAATPSLSATPFEPSVAPYPKSYMEVI